MNKYEYVYILTSSSNTIWNIIIKLIENQCLLISNEYSSYSVTHDI